MRNETWLDALAHELRARSVPDDDRVQVIVETEDFLAETDEPALEVFGPPGDYARTLAEALGVAPRDHHRDTAPLVSVAGLNKSFNGHIVLADFSLVVRRGEIVALTGANGTGKSTLLQLLAGLERPDSGQIEIVGAVGYVPQSGGLTAHLRSTEHFEYFGAAYGFSRAQSRREGERLASQMGWTSGTDPIVGRLSGGNRQKLSVALAMLGGPEVLLLDEPYQGMDASGAQRFWEMLWAWGDAGNAAVVSSHAPDALTGASTVIELGGAP